MSKSGRLVILFGVFLLYFSEARSSVKSCLDLFKRDRISDVVTDTNKRFLKEELEVLFLFREKIKFEGGQSIISSDRDVVISNLIGRITGHKPKNGQRYRLADYEANVLLPAFQGLAYDLAMKAHRKYPNVPLADLQQAALLGLLNAIRSYSADSTYMFSTEAQYPMISEINRVLKELRYPVSFSGSDYSAVSRLLRIETELRVRFGRTPTIQEVVEANNTKYAPLEVDRVRNILYWQKMANSIETTQHVRDKSDGHEQGRDRDSLSVVLDTKPTVEQIVYYKQLQHKLGVVINTMTTNNKKNARIFHLYFGFFFEKGTDGAYRLILKKPLTLREVSDGVIRKSEVNETTPARSTISPNSVNMIVVSVRRSFRAAIFRYGTRDAQDIGALFDALIDRRSDPDAQ